MTRESARTIQPLTFINNKKKHRLKSEAAITKHQREYAIALVLKEAVNYDK